MLMLLLFQRLGIIMILAFLLVNNSYFRQLIVDWENEVVEFKAAGEDYSTGTIGKYFSALSNEANLRGNVRLGWCSV